MQLTPEQMGANMAAYKTLSKCRRELVALLENVTDPVPVVANYFDAEMDKLNFNGHADNVTKGRNYVSISFRR